MKDPTAKQEVNAMTMRVTTKMLNETAKRTGIPINKTSLLSYINKESSSGNTLLDALNKNGKVSQAAASNYKKIGKAAESLKEQADKLAETGEKSFWEKIKESGETEEAYAAATNYVEQYNATLSSLKKSTGALDQYYRKMLQEVAGDNQESLEKIGITVGKDGLLSIDKEKLAAASIEDIQSVFGSGKLASKTAFIADRIASNAQANVESASSQYDKAGVMYAQNASRYDFWG